MSTRPVWSSSRISRAIQRTCLKNQSKQIKKKKRVVVCHGHGVSPQQEKPLANSFPFISTKLFLQIFCEFLVAIATLSNIFMCLFKVTLVFQELNFSAFVLMHVLECITVTLKLMKIMHYSVFN